MTEDNWTRVVVFCVDFRVKFLQLLKDFVGEVQAEVIIPTLVNLICLDGAEQEASNFRQKHGGTEMAMCIPRGLEKRQASHHPSFINVIRSQKLSSYMPQSNGSLTS